MSMGIAVGPATSTPVRLYHITFYKCGSQWVRDMLADSRIVAHTGHSLAAGGIDLQSEHWPQIVPGELAAPLYSTGTGEWRQLATETDRAFVVIRDPRDIVVSLVYSVSLSHTPTAITLLLRTPIADAAPGNRIQIGMFLLAQWAEYLRTWKDATEFSNVHLARYEDLIADLSGELRRLFAFLQWQVPDDVVEIVAAENSFARRSGRKPGEENEFSHRRKGIAGDWRNHFDRKLGQMFESAFPGLLTELHYESGTDWWRDLPETIERQTGDEESQRARLLAVLEEHEKELETVRVAAEERLRDVGILHDALHSEQSACQLHQRRAADLVGQVERLTAELNAVREELAFAQLAARERLDALNALEIGRSALENSLSWRFGYRPLRKIGEIINRHNVE